MDDYQVPQFIEDESRLVGPFSFTQIFILVIGGGMALLFYKLLKGFLGIPIAIILVFLTAILTFTKFNDMPLYKMIVPMIKHFILPKSYQWSQPKGVVDKSLTNKTTTDFNFKDIEKKADMNAVDELTKILDKGNE